MSLRRARKDEIAELRDHIMKKIETEPTETPFGSEALIFTEAANIKIQAAPDKIRTVS